MEQKIDRILSRKLGRIDEIAEDFASLGAELRAIKATAPKIKPLKNIQKHILTEAKIQFETTAKLESRKPLVPKPTHQTALPLTKKATLDAPSGTGPKKPPSFVQRPSLKAPEGIEVIGADKREAALEKSDQRKPPIPKFGPKPKEAKAKGNPQKTEDDKVTEPAIVSQSNIKVGTGHITQDDCSAPSPPVDTGKMTSISEFKLPMPSLQPTGLAETDPLVKPPTEPQEVLPATPDRRASNLGLSRRVSTMITDAFKLQMMSGGKSRMQKAGTENLEREADEIQLNRPLSQERTSTTQPQREPLEIIANARVRRLSKCKSQYFNDFSPEKLDAKFTDKLNEHLSRISENEDQIGDDKQGGSKLDELKLEPLRSDPQTPIVLLTPDIEAQDEQLDTSLGGQTSKLFTCSFEAIASTFVTDFTAPDSVTNLDDLKLLDLNDKMFMIEELETSFDQSLDPVKSSLCQLSVRDRVLSAALSFLPNTPHPHRQKTFLKLQAAQKIDDLDRKIAAIDDIKNSFVKAS